MSEEKDPPQPPLPEQPTLLGNLAPDEMFARGMQSVKMTGGTAGAWQPPIVEEANRLFPNYTVISLLGRGGMGAVYKAKQTALDRLVAIKLLPLEVSVDKDFADRFVREARAMAKLNHPNIITVYDFGTTSEGHLYFVMEYVEGANLADIIHQVGLDPAQALSIVEQVCTALAYAHGKGIVHRDIKPANVMIDTESQVKVADFGLARLTDPSAEQMGHTMTGTVMGTPDYMAPEQMKGMNVDHRADIYSLGVMVYEMLCKEVPRGAFEPPSVRGGCDPRIDPIVIKAMQPNPDRRYQSTQEMKTDVSAVRQPAPEVGTEEAEGTSGGRRTGEPHLRGVQRDAPPNEKGRLGEESLPAPPKKTAAPNPPPKPAPAPLETAVMQAIQPLGPKAKSKAPVFLGIAAVVAIIIAAFVVPKLGGTRSSVSQTSSPPTAGSDRRGSPAPNTQGRAASPRTPTDQGTLGESSLPLVTKDAPFENSLGMKFVPVPIIGGPTDGKTVLFSVWDTRVQDYEEFVKETKRAWPKVEFEQGPTHPADQVSWEDAQLFCQWLTRREQAEGRLPAGFSYRLPSDHEWSCAVGLGAREDAAKLPSEKNRQIDDTFPWGTEWPPPKGAGNYAGEELKPALAAGKFSNVKGVIAGYNDGFVNTSPVGSFAANRFGLYDMGGNVRQWCEEWFDKEQMDRVLRGASWLNIGRNDMLSSDRYHREPGLRGYNVGFRCVLAPAGIADGGTRSSVSQTSPPLPAGNTPSAGEHWQRKFDKPEDHSPQGPSVLRDGWVFKRSAATVSSRFLSSDPMHDGAIRAEFQWTKDGDGGVALRNRIGVDAYELSRKPDAIQLVYVVRPTNKETTLQKQATPAPAEGATYTLELRAIGPMLIASLDGREIFRVKDTRIDSGLARVVLNEKAGVRNLEVLDLDEGRAGARPSDATKDTPFENTLGMKFVPVPILGGPTGGKTVLFSVWDTRVQDYAEFVKETKREWPKVDFEQGPSHPAVNVSWEDAQLFCQWLTERERTAGRLGGHRRDGGGESRLLGDGRAAVGAAGEGSDGALPSSADQTSWVYRLPSDHEWSCAVGIAGEDPAKLPSEKSQKITDAFPWGTEWPPPKGAGNYAGEELQPALAAGKFNYGKGVIARYNDGFVNTSPVGSFAANRFGLYDMGGNVRQWCEDWFDKEQKDRVLRGTAWNGDFRSNLLSSYRFHHVPGYRDDCDGFRCVLATSANPPGAAPAPAAPAGKP